MQPILWVHILTGSLGILSGFVALFAAKGAPLHRKAGMVFVSVMLTMTFTGAVIAAVRGAAPAMNIPAAVLTAYLVVTALATVRPPARGVRWLNLGAMGVALGVTLAVFTFGFDAIARGGSRDGMPAFPFFMFGLIGLCAVIGDLRMIRSGGVCGAKRVARHLWRMSLALWIAVMSFFVGQADEFPRALRIPFLLALPGLTVLVTMLYWVWRVRFRRVGRPLVRAGVPETV